MIIIMKVQRTTGQVVLTVQYDQDGLTKSVDLDAEQITDRIRAFKTLMGRKPTQNEAKELLCEMINEMRRGQQPIYEVIAWENYVGVDLEA